jgi:hypothetical protein
MGFGIPEGVFPVVGYSPNVGAAAAITGDYICLKHSLKCWVVIQYRQADANAITWHVNRATAVAPTGAAVLANAVPIWYSNDITANNTLTRATDAVNFATDGVAGQKLVVFEIDPANLGSTYDCIAGASTKNIAAAQYPAIMYYILPRYTGLDVDFITD